MEHTYTEEQMAELNRRLIEDGGEPLPAGAVLTVKFGEPRLCSPEESADFEERIRMGAEGMHIFPIERGAVYDALKNG